MGLLAWIIFGALAGWLASIVTGRNHRMGCLSNLIAGIGGAVLGGLLMNLLGSYGVTGFDLRSMGVAVLGAVILLVITGWWARRQHHD